ncbi:Nucleotidyltransferase domain containing protein, putative [Leishmania donovani]|uniref:Nucleotidyltransferase domain containing protein, putative n=1 Tax=Leishmania donovani TaxID=5661 RepID=A0A3S7WNR5_LEIDO|nr:Nucleotidyltransferase domain containing protein, putative [Leishmania donovani]
MNSSRSSPPSPQTSATSWSTLPSPATAAGAPSPVSEPHVVYPAPTDATAAPRAVPVCSRFAALRSSVLSPASSTLNLSASNKPAKSVPALEVGTSLLDRRKPSPPSPRTPKAATLTTATTTSAAAAACASHSSKAQHTRRHPLADADSVQGRAGGGVGGASTASSLSAACAPLSASLTAIAASSGKLYRPPHAREDSSKQRWSAGDGSGSGNAATTTDAGTTVSGAPPTPLDSAAAVAGAAAGPTASSSSSPPPLRPSVSAAASKSTDASWWFPVSKANSLLSVAPQRGGSSISAAPSSTVSMPATVAAEASGASPVVTLPPPATCEDDQHGRAGKSPAVHSSVTATPREPGAAERPEPTEPLPKPSRSAKRKQKVRAMAAAAAAAAAAAEAEAEAEAEANRQPDTEVEVEVAAERREVVVAHPKGTSMAATSDRASARIGLGAHSSPARTGSAPTKAAAAPNTSSVSRRPGWHPSFATSAAVSATVEGEGAVGVAGDAEVVGSSGNGGPQMMANGLSSVMPVSFAGALPSKSYAGQTSTMPGMSDTAVQLLPTEMATAGGVGGGGNAGYMNGYGYQLQQLLRHPHQSPTQQYYAASLLSQQQLQMAACGYYSRSHMASPQQQQHRSHARPSTSGVDRSSAAATTSPDSSCASANALLAAGAANTSAAGAAATMFDPANTVMSASGGGAAPPPAPHRVPGLHRGRGAAAATSQSTAGQLAPSASPPPAPAATGCAPPSALLPLHSGHLPSIRVGVSTTMNADSSASPSMTATGGTGNFAAPRVDTLSSNATAMGAGCTGDTMLSMASGMSQHHHYHHHTPPLAHPSSVSGQFSQRPHQHHHQTMSLGSLSLDGGGGGQVNTTHHEDMESQPSMSPGAAQEHISATTSPNMPSRSQGGPSAAVNWGSMGGSNHGRSANAKHKGAPSDCAHSRGSNSHSGSTVAGFDNSRRSGSRQSHTQQQAMMMNQPGNYMSSMYGSLPNPDQQATGHIGSSGGGMMPMHYNALNVGGGGAGRQPIFHHQQPQQQQQQQHTMAKPPPIPYYDFITVLPTFVATCLTLKPEDEANREQLCWIIEAVLRKHLNQNAEIRVHGSITTGLALPSSDVDLLAVGYQPIAPLEALQRLSKALLELDEDSKNDALRLQELIEAEAQHRRRQLMEEAKKRAKQVALAAATGAGVAVAPDEGRHWARESRCSASEVCEAASLRDSDSDADDDDTGRRSEENASEGEGTSGLSPKRVARAGSIVKSLLLSSTEAAEEMPVIGEMDEAARAAPNRRVSSHSRRSPCVPQDGTATTAPQRSVSASSLSTESSTTCFSATAFPLDTRKVFLTSSATVGDDGEFVRLASGSGTVPGAGATSTCAKSAVGHTDSVSASRLHDPDVATADTEVYGTVGDVEQAEEVFRGQIEKDYNFSTSVDLSALFAPSMGGGMPPVAPPVAAASGLSIGGASSSSSGLAFQTTTTRLHDSASLSSPRESAAASGSADLKGSVRSLPPAMASGLHVDEDNIAAHAQPLPRSKAAPADADKLANEAELRSSQARLADGGAAEPEGRTVSGGGDATAAEAEAAHAGTETVAADEAAAAQSSSVSPTAAASGERAATVQTAAAPPASQDAVTRSPIVLGDTDGRGRGAGHLTYVPVHEGPLFFVQSITATRVPVIKLTDKATGTKVDITFAGGEHWRSMQLTRSLLEVFPHARTLILFLKYCVRSLGAGESEPGGVTSFAIYLMVLHFYNECRQRILLLLRERNAASSPAQAQSRQAGADTGEHQQPQKDRAAEEALRRGGAADNSATSPTAGPAPLTLGLLEYMLGEYLARVEQRHAQLVEETGARRSVSLDAAGSDDVAELYSSSGNIQKAAPALGRASSSTAVATGACATIKAAYASDDKERLRAIRQTILGFVGDPAAATTAAGASVTAAVALALAPQTTTGATPEKEGGAGRTQQTRPTSSDAAESASGGGAAAGASSSTSTSTPSPLREHQPPNLTGTAGLGGTTTTTTPSAGEELAAVVDAAPGRLAPPPHHYLLKTVEPQPHERVVGEGSHVDTPGAYEVAGRDEKVAEDTSAEHSTAAMATPEALHQETRADAAAAAVAEGTETPEELVSAAAGSAANVDPVKAGRGSAQSASLPAETETAGAAGAHASRVAEAAAAAAASTSKRASEQHSDADSEDSAFDAFAADFLRRQAEVSDLFLDFCHYYGCAFDYETSGIRFTIDGRSEVVAKPFLCSRRGQHFHMTSPFDPEYDLTARMTHMRDFQWLCWWFAEWGAARQSPQYYGSCSLQYVLQCLSPMSADADCQAVHQALMKQAVAAARRAESTAAATLTQHYSNGGAAGEGGHPHHSMSAPMLAFQESTGRSHHMMLMQQQQQQQSAPRQPHTMMMSMDGNTKLYGAQQQQPQSMRSSTTTMMPMTLRAHPQQPQQHAGGVPVPPMNVYNGPSVEQQRCGGAGVAQHSVAAPFPHLQSTMMSPGSPVHAYQQQQQQQASPSEASGMDTDTHVRGGGLGEHDHRSAPHLKYGGSISIASTAAKKGSATAHETAAIRAASSGSRSRPASECGATAAAAVSARTRARRRPPLQLPYVDSREEAFEGSSSHAAITPTAAGMMAVHSYPTENNDDVDGGNSPRCRVDVMLTPVKGDEDEEDEAGGRYGDRGYGSESVVDYTDCLDQCGGRGDANAVMPQHYPQQLAPHDAQATAEGNAGVGEHGAGGLCNGYSPNMAYAGNQGYAASQQQQVSYGSPHPMNRAAGVYVSPQQQQQFRQQQEHAAAAAAFYYQAFAQQQQRQQQQVPYPPSPQLKQPQPIISSTSSGFVATAGTSSSSSYPFPALYYDLQQHLWQQQQQYHTTRNSSGFVGVAPTAAAADQDGGSSHRSDGTSSTTATSASAQQQQQQVFPYTPYVGYPSVAFGVGGTHNTDATRTAAGGGEMPQQHQQPDMVAMPSMMTYQSAAAVATGSPVNTSSDDAGVSASEPPPKQQQQQSAHGGYQHPASHHRSGGGDGRRAASQ